MGRMCSGALKITSLGPYTAAITLVLPCSRYALPSALLNISQKSCIIGIFIFIFVLFLFFVFNFFYVLFIIYLSKIINFYQDVLRE